MPCRAAAWLPDNCPAALSTADSVAERRTSGRAAAQRMHEALHDAQLAVLRHCLQLAVLQALYQLPWAQPQISLRAVSDQRLTGP